MLAADAVAVVDLLEEVGGHGRTELDQQRIDPVVDAVLGCPEELDQLAAGAGVPPPGLTGKGIKVEGAPLAAGAEGEREKK